MIQFDLNGITGQNETAQPVGPTLCESTTTLLDEADTIVACKQKATWAVLRGGQRLRLVCSAHKKDYQFTKGRLIRSMHTLTIVPYSDDEEKFRITNALYRFTGGEMRQFTKQMNAAGTPLVFEKRHEGPQRFYVSKGITKRTMNGWMEE